MVHQFLISNHSAQPQRHTIGPFINYYVEFTELILIVIKVSLIENSAHIAIKEHIA